MHTSRKALAALGISALAAGTFLATTPAHATGLGWTADQWDTKTLVDFNGDGGPDTVKSEGKSWKPATKTEITCKVRFDVSDGYGYVREYVIKHNAATLGRDPEKIQCPEIHEAATIPGTNKFGAVIRASKFYTLPNGADYALVDFSGTVHAGGTAKHLPTANSYGFMDLNQDGISDMIVQELDNNSWGRIGLVGRDGNVSKWLVVQNGVYGVYDFDPTVRGVEVLVHQTDPVPGVKCINKGHCLALFSPKTWSYRAVPEVATLLQDRNFITRGYHKDANGDGFVDIQVRDVQNNDEPVHFLNDGKGNFTRQNVEKPTGPAPVARRDYVVMYEKYGRSADINVLGNDKYTGPVKISFNTLKPGKTHHTPDGRFRVTPDNKVEYTRTDLRPGTDLTYYTITDRWGRKHQSKLVIKWQRTAASAPIARNDRVRMYPGRFDVAGINVLRNDKNASAVKVSITKHPKVGTAEVMRNGRIRYNRKGKPVKNDVFEYKITDAQGRSSTARVAIDVE